MLVSRRLLGFYTALLVGLDGLAVELAAQALPDSIQCAAAVQQIRGGTVDSSRLAWSRVPWCDASVAGPAVAAAVRRLGVDWATESRYFDGYAAGLVRDDHVFDASLFLALNPRASSDARLAALDILGRQTDPNHPSGVKEDGTCWTSASAEYMGTPTSWTPLGEGKMAELLQGLASIAADRNAPAMLRRVARCLAIRSGWILPPDAQPGDFSVEPVCQLRIRLTSRAPEHVVLRVLAQDEAFGVQIDPGATRTVSISSPGQVRVLLGDSQIWTGIPPEGRCPP